MLIVHCEYCVHRWKLFFSFVPLCISGTLIQFCVESVKDCIGIRKAYTYKMGAPTNNIISKNTRALILVAMELIR